MKLIRGLINIRPEHRGGVATIGNFDGVHLGHQQVIQRVISLARAQQQPASVISFEPLPQEYFSSDKAPARLQNLRDKYQSLAETGIDQLLLLPFNRRLAKQSAQVFCQQVLQEGLGLSHLIVGDDFRFGHQRQGDYAFLQDFAEHTGMGVEPSRTYEQDGQRISSTRVREHLAKHQLAHAKALLGRAFCLSGRVAHGDKLGRTLGYPTLNVLHKRQRLPVAGAFAIECQLSNGRRYHGMANAGLRPTVHGLSPRLEAHLFDFDQQVYGEYVTLTLKAHLRPEVKFTSIDALREQLQHDEQQARALSAQPS